jgi:hypothetical protein
MQNYVNTVMGTNGDAIAGATVTVTTLLGAPAVLYGADGSSPLGTNILTTDSKGGYSFYADNGRYTLTITHPGFTTQQIADAILYDP